MSGGWTTGVGAGLLEGVNNNMAYQQQIARKQQQEGMDAQMQSFALAAKEYDNEKKEVADRTAKMQANASMIAGGAPDEMALALAYRFDQATQGKKDLEGDLLDQQQRNYKYMQDNPQVVKRQTSGQSTTPQFFASQQVPSNIQPDVMARYGVNQDQLNDVYGHKPEVNSPSSVIPSGVPMADVAQQKIRERLQTELPYDAKKIEMEAVARERAGSSPEAIEAIKAKAKAQQQGQLEAGGYRQNTDGSIVPMSQPVQPPNTPQMAPQPSSATPDMAQPPAQGQATPPQAGQVNASDLQPGAPLPQGQNGQPPAPQAPQGPATAQPTQQPQGDTLPAYLKALDKKDKRNYDVLKQLTPEDAKYLIAVSNGQRAFSSPYLMARGDAVVKHLAKTVNDFDPSYSDNRMANLKTFQSGQNASTVTDLNTALNHMGLLNEAGKALQQNNVVMLNKIANSVGVQEGKAPAVVFDNISHYVSSELRKAYSGRNGGGLAELQSIAEGIDKSHSPEQRMGVLKSNANLLTGKINSIDHQYQGIMGDAYVGNNFLEPQAKKVYEDLTANTPAAQQQMGNAPDFSHLWNKK